MSTTSVAPESILNVDLSYWPVGESMGPHVSWRKWTKLRGGGFCQWLKWAWAFGLVMQQEMRKIRHEELHQERRCHVYEEREYHYCGRTEGRNFPIVTG